LTIHCKNGNAELFVETGMALEVTMVDMQYVRLQLDDNKPYAQKWHEATNATVWARHAPSLIKQLAQSKKFIFEFTPFSSLPAQAEFNVVGLSAFLPKLSKVCW